MEDKVMLLSDYRFTGYVDLGTHWTAEFVNNGTHLSYEKRNYLLDKESLEERVANLKRNGIDASIEEGVLRLWPVSSGINEN
jgi:hypothetical protein